MQKADHERPALGPARVGLKVGEDVFGIMAAVLGNDEDGDDNGEDTGKGPENGSGLNFSQRLVHHSQITGRANFSLTSRIGNQRLPSEETALQRRVRPRKMRKTWYGSPARTPTPGSDSNTLMHATKKSAVPKFTARVMVMFPTT